MNRSERLRRDHGIIASYCAGKPSAEIAATFGITSRYVHTIVKRVGLSRPRGRPAAIPHADDETLAAYRRYRRHHGAEMARKMVGVQA